MLVASKYEEIWAPEVKDFVFISDEAYTREQILEMEKIMLNTLRFNLTVPTAFAFLHRYLKAGAVPKASQVRCCQRLTQYTSHFCSCVAFRGPWSMYTLPLGALQASSCCAHVALHACFCNLRSSCGAMLCQSARAACRVNCEYRRPVWQQGYIA